MILISEWLPNPEGADAGAEWIELYNMGGSAVAISGWELRNGRGVAQKLSGTVPANTYTLIKADQKFSLRNSEEELTLVDADGSVRERSAFAAEAPSGLSFAKSGSHFRWLAPSPGAPNPIPSESPIPYDTPLAAQASPGFVVGTACIVAILFSCISLYFIRTHHDLSHLFFPRN